MAKLDLLNNARDSLRHGYKHFLRAASVSDYKQAVLNIHLGIELLLKERLRQINPLYVFAGEFDFERLLALAESRTLLRKKPKSPSLNTVGFGVALERLEFFSEVVLRFRSELKALAEQRNALVHFEAYLEQNELDILLGKRAFAFVVCFLEQELDQQPADFLSTDLYLQLALRAEQIDERVSRMLSHKIKEAHERVEGLSHDEVRARSVTLDALERSLRHEGQQVVRETCPVCEHTCLLVIEECWSLSVDETGLAAETVFWTGRLECVVCSLKLEPDETLRYFPKLRVEVLAQEAERGETGCRSGFELG